MKLFGRQASNGLASFQIAFSIFLFLINPVKSLIIVPIYLALMYFFTWDKIEPK